MAEAEAPASWSPEVVDRDRWGGMAGEAIERLAAAHRQDRLPSSLLLVGPAAMGRELAALETACLLTCPEGGGPWCRCRSCRRVREGIHPDVNLVLPQGAGRQIRIDQVRRVVESASGRPFESGRRVWILDGVESGRFGAEAANAFLKTLEEPPDHAAFLLLASNPDRVLPTLRSRCQRLVLPGLVAVARHLGRSALPPELAGLAEAPGTAELMEHARHAVVRALEGELRPLLCLPRLAEGNPAPFAVIAAVVLQQAVETEGRREQLVRLAADLLRCGERTAALRLSAARQLLSGLLAALA